MKKKLESVEDICKSHCTYLLFYSDVRLPLFNYTICVQDCVKFKNAKKRWKNIQLKNAKTRKKHKIT